MSSRNEPISTSTMVAVVRPIPPATLETTTYLQCLFFFWKEKGKTKAQKATLKVLTAKRNQRMLCPTRQSASTLHYDFGMNGSFANTVKIDNDEKKAINEAQHLSQSVLDTNLGISRFGTAGMQEKSFVDAFGNFFLRHLKLAIQRKGGR